MTSRVYYTRADDKDTVNPSLSGSGLTLSEVEWVKSVTEKLDRLIDKSGVLSFIEKRDFTAVKLHFGEEGNTGHLKSEWVKKVVQHIGRKTKNVFLTDTNVLYKNSVRADSVSHLKTAYEHGYNMENVGAPILIADGLLGKNFHEIPISKKHFSKVKIASDIANCDSMVTLTHITGHMQTGFGGAIKNLGMGCASRRGKYEQHSGVIPKIAIDYCTGCGLCVLNCPASCIVIKSKKAMITADKCIGCGECVVACRTKAIDIEWSETLENLQEKMVEYAYGAVKAVKGKAGFISFIIKVTKDCDCLAKDDPRVVEDLGLLASCDPVSIDKAAIDIINEYCGKDFFKELYPNIDCTVQLRHASRIGLGHLNYKLIRL